MVVNELEHSRGFSDFNLGMRQFHGIRYESTAPAQHPACSALIYLVMAVEVLSEERMYLCHFLFHVHVLHLSPRHCNSCAHEIVDNMLSETRWADASIGSSSHYV
jgi:hypothetical protein